MAVLAKNVYDVMRRNNVALPADVFGFLEEVLKQPRPIPEIASAIALSFVEPGEDKNTRTRRWRKNSRLTESRNYLTPRGLGAA
jgi:hypothetical protein